MSALDEKLKEIEQRLDVCSCGSYHCVVCGNQTRSIVTRHYDVPKLLTALRKCREQRNSWAFGLCKTKDELRDNQADRNEEDAELLAILNGEGEK